MRLVLAAALLLLSACTTVRATHYATPTERVTECRQLCTDVGLEMSAMVVIMNSAGCVCEVPRQYASDPVGASSAVSGGAIITAALQAQQQQQAAVVVRAR